jgi:hypothetical protein
MPNEDPSPDDAATASPPPAMPAADTSFDLSLRLLTALVMVALAGSVSLLVYRWIAPRLEEGNSGPVPASTRHPAPAASAPDQAPPHRDEILMDPGRVFKCEEQGRVTFSDQACPGAGSGSAQRPAAGAAPPPPAPANR